MRDLKKITRNIAEIIRLNTSSPILEINDTKFIFIHINKTAGTSILNALEVKKKQHLTSKEVIQKIGKDKWDNVFKFSIVRNPWAKVYSHYKYRIKTNQTSLGDQTISFNDWVKETYGTQNYKYYDNPKMFAPQLTWLRNENDELDMDFIGKFENLPEDFKVIKKELKLKRDLQHLNATKADDFRIEYNQESIEIVSSWFKEDIEYFNYSF